MAIYYGMFSFTLYTQEYRKLSNAITFIESVQLNKNP